MPLLVARRTHCAGPATRGRIARCPLHPAGCPPPARFPLPTAVARLLSAARRTRCTLYSACRKLHAPTALRRQDSPCTLLFGRYIHTHSQPLRRYVLALAISREYSPPPQSPANSPQCPEAVPTAGAGVMFLYRLRLCVPYKHGASKKPTLLQQEALLLFNDAS
ncbi:hypothetical protein GGX14DRAFT_399952 [Mycena pura]|uniref:Uncharacterized protein n=1 Tax=Mycena pura TaxID=153505 RepID=A0AAD6YA11_9AGAR|nr:hypothetical protein GGX14DRAFT_399952 [Mycena pura]